MLDLEQVFMVVRLSQREFPSAEVMKTEQLTGQYLSGKNLYRYLLPRRKPDGRIISIKGAKRK